jgi:hypothetical protein
MGHRHFTRGTNGNRKLVHQKKSVEKIRAIQSRMAKAGYDFSYSPATQSYLLRVAWRPWWFGGESSFMESALRVKSLLTERPSGIF